VSDFAQIRLSGLVNDGNMTDFEKRIEQLETQAAEAALLARLAGEPAMRAYNALQAEDLMALANTLRTLPKARPVVARAQNGDQRQ
jgi:hypothetical protein